MAHTINNTGQGYYFSVKLYRQPVKLLMERWLKILLLEPLIVLLRFGVGLCLLWVMNIWAPGHPYIRNGKINHCKQNQPNYTRNTEQILLYLCSHSVILLDSDWLGTDWWRCSGIFLAAPNGTSWFCFRNLWLWLPPRWLGQCTLDLPGHRGESVPW